jgi:hypothetical protein
MRFFKCLVTGSLKQSVKKRDLREKKNIIIHLVIVILQPVLYLKKIQAIVAGEKQEHQQTKKMK